MDLFQLPVWPDAAWALVLAESAIKGILILGVAVALSPLLRNTSAAFKHLYWMLALTAVLAVPLVSSVVPKIQVDFVRMPVEQPQPRALDAAARITPGLELFDARSPGSTSETARLAGPAQERLAPPVPSSSGAVQVGSSGIDWMRAVVIAWILGATLVLLHLCLSTLRAALLVRRARPVLEPWWTVSLADAADRLQVRRRVRLLWSDDVGIPFSWGFLRPVVVIPPGGDRWPAEKRRCVLTHELAHVKRMDCLTQTVAVLACAAHWFNPLAWHAARRMRLEREKACDAAVLDGARTRASSYAEHLMDIALSLADSRRVPAAAVTMASRSQLEGRIMAILTGGGRGRLGWRQAAAAVCVSTFAVIFLAAMHPAGAEEAGSSETAMATVSNLNSMADESTTDPAASSSRRDASSRLDDLTATPSRPDDPTGSEKTSKLESSPTSSADVVQRSFQVAPGGTLVIDADMGNIRVESSSQDRVDIEVRRRARGAANEEDFELTFRQDGDRVEVRGERVREMRRSNGLSVDFVVTVPRRFNVDLNTAGGNISIDDLDGAAAVRTAGGNLSFGDIRGTVEAHTSGGNVSIDGSDGNVTVTTSGGNVSLGRIGGTVDVQTSGGNISVDEVGGDIRAVTSGGQIMARIAEQPQGDCLLRTSGGGITVYLAPDLQVNLEAETSAGRVNTDIEVTFEGRIEKERLRGTINGGGPKLVLDTAAGNINIRRL